MHDAISEESCASFSKMTACMARSLLLILSLRASHSKAGSEEAPRRFSCCSKAATYKKERS